MARAPALAKLTRPKLYDALARPRLFDLLDEAASRPIVWICAPPGAGKSTLVASWLEARKLRHIWYQVDVGDADPATYVHYMRIAAEHVAGKAAAALPLYTSELQQNLARFARGFFRDFFSVLPHPCVVVLDNFHEARTTSEHRAALAQGMEEIPEGFTVVVMSRTEPPAEFARLIANRRIARIDEAELRCTAKESEAILGGAHLDASALERIQRQSDGWVAALVLLREHLSRHGAAIDASLAEGKETIFQYFAGEIFNSAQPANQRALMLTAIPPSFTQADAEALTGRDDVGRLLDYLYRRHLFTDRRRGAQTTYHYHALFREFLLEEMRARLSADEQRVAHRRAAELLAGRGQASDALTLYREAGEWEPMHALIRANALDWARQGRAQALSDWIGALPQPMRESDPWLEYWFGRAWIFVDPKRGRPALERAHAAFKAAGDLRGQALALSTIVTGVYYEWANFAPLDRWLPEFEQLFAPGADLDPESDLRAHAALLIVLLFRKPHDPRLAPCAERLHELLAGDYDVNVQTMAASTLFNYINWRTNGEMAPRLVAHMAPVLERPEATPLMQVWWRTHLSFWHYINGRYGESTRVIAEARAIAERYGLEAYLFEIDHAEVSALISKGDFAAAKAQLDEMERRLAPSRRMDWAYFHYLRSMLEQRTGQFAAAVREAEAALALGRETGLPTLQMPHFYGRLAHAKLAAGDNAGGFAALDQAIALSPDDERSTFEHTRELVEIGLDIDAGNVDAATARLSAVLAGYRARAQTVFLRNRPDLAARLLDFALVHGIEPDCARILIEKNALAAPPDAGPAWPFRLRVRALGGFELIRDGHPVRSSGKTQQRPLDLLKLLVALGANDVDSQLLMTSLWPDAEGAAAKTSFDTTLFRLRKLVDVDNALVLAAGKLSLARTLAWTDVWALDAAIDAAQRVADGVDGGPPALAARRLLEAYPGPLLGSEEEPWIAKPRDALRARVVRALLRLGERLEREGDWTTAVDVYRRGLEADNLAETFYRGLMRALAATGDQAEAINAFRRCRELLSIVLGVKPSAETDRLYQEIAAGRAPARLS
ncbi:MAG TPA: BTAD domain-containing putative transcriptional regulator [Casimicrobiaceae bacterium]|nr:BTAD domain-containing putative transcriptional regulator [Casimicrobiaceae bacterium]